MSTIRSFHASVAQDAISKVTRLFNASLDDIFAELIQNARRAGASSISIDQVEHETLGAAIRIADNGPGILDPKSLFTLGQSAWDGTTVISEDAAGMGFFALAGRRIHLIVQEVGTTRSWMLDADPAAFNGGIPITCSAGPDDHSGMTIVIEARSDENLVAAANRAAHYCPIEVIVEGVVAEREDFLEQAHHIEIWNGIRIGLYDRSAGTFRRNSTVNFYGVTLHASLPYITQSFHRGYYARLDVIDCARLKLVLPARKEIVADAFFNELQQQILKVMFQRIAASGPHSLSFAQWNEAQSLGVNLPAATMTLRPFSPCHADGDNNEMKSPEAVTSESLLLDSDAEAVDEQNLALALSGVADGPTLYEPNGAFNGYAWYDALSCVALYGYRVVTGDDEERVAVGDNTLIRARPDRLYIEGEIGTATDLIPWRLETDVLILGSDDYCDLDDISLCVTATSNVTHDDLIDLLTRALFCPSEDAEAGSYDAQLQWFTDQAEDLVIKLLESDDEANIQAVIRVVSRELYWLKNRDRAVTIHIGGGLVSVTGLASETRVQ